MTTQPHECGDDGKLKPAAQYICELAAWGQALEREVALLRTDYCTREERNYLQARVAELEAHQREDMDLMESTSDTMANGTAVIQALTVQRDRYCEALTRIKTAIIAGAETGTIVDTLWMASGIDTVVDFIDSTLNP